METEIPLKLKGRINRTSKEYFQLGVERLQIETNQQKEMRQEKGMEGTLEQLMPVQTKKQVRKD